MFHDDDDGGGHGMVEHVLELQTSARMAIACASVCVERESRAADRLTHQHESRPFGVVFVWSFQLKGFCVGCLARCMDRYGDVNVIVSDVFARNLK